LLLSADSSPAALPARTRLAEATCRVRALLIERESLRETIIGVNDAYVSDHSPILSPQVRFQIFSKILLRAELNFRKACDEVLFRIAARATDLRFMFEHSATFSPWIGQQNRWGTREARAELWVRTSSTKKGFARRSEQDEQCAARSHFRCLVARKHLLTDGAAYVRSHSLFLFLRSALANFRLSRKTDPLAR